MATNKIRVCFNKSKVVVANADGSTENSKISGTVTINSNKSITFAPEIAASYKKFNHSFADFVAKICAMGLKHKDFDVVLALCEKLIDESNNLAVQIAKSKSELKLCEVIQAAQQHVEKKFKEVKSRHLRNVQLKLNPLYVQPVEMAIGLKWRTKTKPNVDLPDHHLIQTTLQYVPIAESLKAIFLRPGFKELYMRYNSSEKHECVDGVYQNFCCASNFRNNQIFRSNAIVQIQFGIDDFDPCCAQKSKATFHKTCGVYFMIRNLPHSSKLNNYFLVALCNSNNLKEKEDGFDTIAKLIVSEMKTLAADGIDIDEETNLKVAMVNISFDNLGANNVLGLIECFSCDFFCRICECTLEECQTLTSENPSKLRRMSTYLQQLNCLKLGTANVSNHIQGIKKYCVFNELNYFNLFEYPSVDIMHDVYEGLIPFFLSHFFTYCKENKIETEDSIVRKIRDFNYGQLNSRNKPSLLKIDRKNLGQNATQIYCIMLHLPFIFADKMSLVPHIAPVMSSLLQIIQIISSKYIRECDILHLEKNIEIHLSGSIELFNVKLLAKHHFVTHYPSVIRKMGPLRHMWMMRFESKHKFFTDIAKVTNNFMNLQKTMAMRHQEMICLSEFSFCDNIIASKKKTAVSNIVNYDQYADFLKECTEIQISQSIVVDFARLNNSYLYREGIMIIENSQPYEIISIINFHDIFFFICHSFDIVEFNDFYNSIEIKKGNDLKLLKLNNQKPYEKKLSNRSIFIIAENLDVYNSHI